MKIIIAAGGTGGHVFPAISTAKELEKQNQIIFFTTDGLAYQIIRNSGFEPWAVCQRKRSSRNIFLFIVRMMQSIRECFCIMQKALPDVVVGFGGYPAFPVVFSAWFLKIPILIHEQNVVPGKANQVAGMFADKIAVSFKETKEYFNSKKCVLTGCPSRFKDELQPTEEDFKKFDFKKERATILVFGGSQASQKINSIFSEAAILLKGNFNFQFIHISGKDDYYALCKKYLNNKFNFKLFDFVQDMASAYRVADLVIARSGASTISELITFKKPSILIPYPVERVHQKENALVLSRVGAAVIIEESNLSEARLHNEIISFFKKEKNKASFDEGMKQLQMFDSEKKLAQEVVNLRK
ncbi:MAG: undecaprenyldiphospho-muramoylpentapeptide beta-N-acetylglucosaminyltransferase [Candidatus Omnitrophica bacterium]|nr:undecaprenyldiphospho-muramoylpentapeptide beta-N-acetylglucosaminyltransferase [Candidatus Omnitrophota bacterium]